MKSILKGLVLSSLLAGTAAQAQQTEYRDVHNVAASDGYFYVDGNEYSYTHDLTTLNADEIAANQVAIDNGFPAPYQVFTPTPNDGIEYNDILSARLGFSFVSEDTGNGEVQIDIDDINFTIVENGVLSFNASSDDLDPNNQFALNFDGIAALNEDGTLDITITRVGGDATPFRLTQARLYAQDAPLGASSAVMILSGLGLCALRRKKFA